MRQAPPNYLSTLVVAFPRGAARHAAGFADVPGIFRSDHASNYLPLKGTLPRDRARLLAELDAAENGEVQLRPESARGL